MELNQSNSTELKKNEDVAKLFAWKSFRLFLAENWPLKELKCNYIKNKSKPMFYMFQEWKKNR